jgi:glycosyltransferase involved in cell wall biosynthesis
MLTWSLIVCTYMREKILPRCIRCALRSTRLPGQVIVVDASPDWDLTREAIREEFGSAPSSIEFLYLKANRASLTAQRNQGLDAASGDVAFMIDDDALLFPDTAQRVMEVYEADARRDVVAVTPAFVPEVPDAEPGPRGLPGTDESKSPLLRRVVRRLLWSDVQLLPYGNGHWRRDVPEHLKPFGLIPLPFSGGSATFRTAIVRAARFEEMLERYASGEDWDISERIRHRGLIALLPSARQCHLAAAGGRLSQRTVIMLRYLNYMALHVVNSRDVRRSRRMYRQMLSRRVIGEALSDLMRGRWRFPRAAGSWRALARLGEMFEKSAAEMRGWYPVEQRRIIARDRLRSGEERSR